MNLDRRTLLVGGGIGVGLVVAFAAWPRRPESDLELRSGEQAFGQFIKIGQDGQVTVAVPQVETGQGIWTALPQVVADELGAAWENVAVEPAPLVGGYGNPLAKEQGWLEGFGTLQALRIGSDGRARITAGSTSTRAFEQPMREAAAVARAMLVGAAAERWNVAPSECEARGSAVLRAGQRLTFAELAEEAASRGAAKPILRQPGTGGLLGKPLQRLDAPPKTNGSLRFAADVRLPGMLFASVRMAPPGGRVSGYAREAVDQAPGIRHLAVRDGWIAIVAESFWAADKAMKAAAPTFTGRQTPPDLRPLFEAAIDRDESTEWFSSGDYDEATASSRALAATYYAAPSQHLGLEPVAATARFTGGALELWAPTLAPGFAQALAASAAGVSDAEVSLYPMPVGDPAGSALESEVVPVAIALARKLGRPVQATLSQHAAQNHDRVSPGIMARMTALPGANGIPEAWQMRVATADGIGSALARLGKAEPPGKLGLTALDGAVPPYAIPNLRVQAIRTELPVLTGYMRGSPQRELSFATESFVDELARAAGMEPLAFRMSMLGSQPRLARCLQLAARAAQWDGGRPGSTMGIAGCSALGSHIGLVAVASIDQGRLKAHKLVAAVDCGRVVNSGLVRQQIEGGLIWALAQATAASPEWVAGMPRARAIGGIALPRIGDTPEFVTHIVPSSDAPGGVSGLGTTVLAPALANAIFAGSGRRLRSLPFDLATAA